MEFEKLREAREAKGYTQAYMAREVGVSLTAYQLWEQCVSKPKEENMIKLKKVLGIR